MPFRLAFLLQVLFLSHLFSAAQLPQTALGNADAARSQARRFAAGRRPASADPQVAIPVLHAAVQPPHKSDVLSSVSLAAPWSPLGPAFVQTPLYGAVTGRVTAVAVDPNDATGNTVWLGTTGGGVWKSTNATGPLASVTFVPLTDTLPAFSRDAGSSSVPALSIGALAVQPAPNPVVLAGTGDPNDATDSYYGEGLLRSADGGQTWALITSSRDGANGIHHFDGLATAGIAWSSATPSLVVAGFTPSAEGSVVGSVTLSIATPGLYYSTDAGVTWHMATVMDGTQLVQAPTAIGTQQLGTSPTAVVWNPQRHLFFAALRRHGYYSSPDGQNWQRLPNQPGTGLTAANCPAGAVGEGSQNCPMLRGALAVQPATGDTYALTVDANEVDQGLWQDLCAADANGVCFSPTPTFATRLDNGALEAGQGAVNGSKQIPQGSYDLALLAAPTSNNGTLLFAGTVDLYRCVLGAGARACTFRNTTNAGNGCNATSAVAPAQHGLAAVPLSSTGLLLYIGNDGGLWRSLDGVAQTGSACSASDASHFDNLNAALGAGGSLAEVVGFAQDPAQGGTMVAGLGALGTAATANAAPGTQWTQLSGGEGGFPVIDPLSPNNWSIAIGTGVNVRSCVAGPACAAADFAGSADIGAVQTNYDTALLDAPVLLDPQLPSNLLTATCRVWRGPASGGTAWNAASALSPAFDNAGTPCRATSALVRSVGAGGPISTSGPFAAQGATVLYAGMAGLPDGGGSVPGHVFVTKAAQNANGSLKWTDITGSPVASSSTGFNSDQFDVSSLVTDPHDTTGATVYATVMGFGAVPHVYRSVDFGAHWLNIHGNLPASPANGLVVDPNDANTVYVATDAGVYVTSNVTACPASDCWSLLGTGLPNAPVTQIAAAPSLPTGDGRIGMLRAGTYGRGLWQTPLLTAHGLTQPQLSASPVSLTFLTQPVGTQSDALSINLLSFGTGAATISSITIHGDFAETDTCTGTSVVAGANCTISVRFAPTATGARSGSLTIFANVPGGQLTVALSGNASAPAAIVLTPLQLTFPATTVNSTAAAQIITVANTGANTAAVQAPTVTGDFAIVANTCGASLPSQTACSISIAFQPTASGSRTGVLSVTDSAGTQTAQLAGVGHSPATDTLSPVALAFPQQQTGTTSAPQQVTLTNAGDVTLGLIKAVVAAGDYTVTSNCGASLAAHSSCAFSVAFVPAATGARAGVLQITDEFRTQTVSLSGAAVAPPGVSLTPSALNFNTFGVGLSSPSQALVLTNNGGLPLHLQGATATGDFRVVSNSCGDTLAPASACTIVLAFAPTQPGARSGQLTLKDDAGTGMQTVTLSGTGVDFSLVPDGATSETVASGAIGTFPLRLSSVAGLTGTVAFSCAGTPASVACTVNPAPAQLGGSVNISVTLQTGVANASSARLRPSSGEPSSGARGVPAFAVILLVPGAFLARRRRRAPYVVLLFGAALACAVGLCGCGTTRLIPISGDGGGSGSGLTSPATSPGTYPITVTGTSSGISHAVSLTLVVQ